MANTYTKGGSQDTWIFPGSLNVTGTFTAAGAQLITLDATEEAFDIDAGTTDHTGANIIDVNLDVNSANCKVINADIDVGTALSTGENVYGVYINQDGLAGDDAASGMTAFYATSANATGGVNKGVELGGTFDTGIALGAAATDGILISGACTDAIHVSGATTNGINLSGTATSGINFNSVAAIGTLINATAACAHLATRGIFIGVDSNTEGNGIALNGSLWATSQGNALYTDDGGVAATGYTESFTVRHLTTATVASGDVSFVAIHPDMYLNADYTGIGSISSIWGNTTIATGKIIDTSGGIGDVGGASFGIDIVGTLALNSHACGCSVGVGGSGTKTGILSGFRVRGATGTVDWDAFLSIEDGDGSWTSMTTVGSGKTPTLGTAGPTGSDSDPAYWMNIYIGETKYYFPVWVAT